MTDTTISVRIDRNLKDKMKIHEEINWSAILRRAILQQLEKEHKIDFYRAKRASKRIDQLRESGAFNKGEKTASEIIKEWRHKKRF